MTLMGACGPEGESGGRGEEGKVSVACCRTAHTVSSAPRLLRIPDDLLRRGGVEAESIELANIPAPRLTTR